MERTTNSDVFSSSLHTPPHRDTESLSFETHSKTHPRMQAVDAQNVVSDRFGARGATSMFPTENEFVLTLAQKVSKHANKKFQNVNKATSQNADFKTQVLTILENQRLLDSTFPAQFFGWR